MIEPIYQTSYFEKLNSKLKHSLYTDEEEYK